MKSRYQIPIKEGNYYLIVFNHFFLKNEERCFVCDPRVVCCCCCVWMSFLEDSDGVLYQEDESDVLVQVSLPPGTRAAHVSVALQAALKLEVAVQGRPVLAGVLTERVKEPIWTLVN